MALKRAGCGLALVALKRTGCDVWQMDCQASNVTANVPVTTFCTDICYQSFFATAQLHHPPRSAEIQPMSQRDISATRPYRGLVFKSIRVKNEKDENLRILQRSAVTFFTCGG